MAARKTLRRTLFEWLLAGGALVALASGILDYLKELRNLEAMQRMEQCKMARDALVDDRLNLDLTEAQRKTYLATQLRIAADCAKTAK
jgi:hypothetical protein